LIDEGQRREDVADLFRVGRVTLYRAIELLTDAQNEVPMPTAVKIWEIIKGSLHPVTGNSFAENHLEKELETWVAEEPSILGERVLMIARQKQIPGP